MKFIIKKKHLIWTAVAVLIFAALILGLVLGYRESKGAELKGAVVANGIECADIGRSILAQDGSAVDAAIATLFCEGVACPQSMGLGGGFFATIYKRSTKTIETLIARESAPLAATENMFVNKTVDGALSVAVPGELKGYWSLHQKYGRLSWASLVQPTIDLCRKGIQVSNYLAKSLKRYEHLIKNASLHLDEIFINPETNEVWNEGDLMKRPKLAETLEMIAKEGAKAMYDGGSLGKMLVEDIKELGGILTEEDFKEYKDRWRKPILAKINGGYTLYTTPLPSGGIILSFILNLLNTLVTKDRPLFYHRITESFKHAYGQRTQLGDDKFLPPHIMDLVANLTNNEFIANIRQKILDDKTFTDYGYYGANFSDFEDHGTANMAVLAPNGDAITVTSTVNTIFGAKFRSKRTGIILNDEMDDFSTPGKPNGFGIPPSPANFIKPKKIPMSSMCPSIILNNNGDVRLLIGAAGGSKITTSVAQTIIKYLLFNEPLNEAVQGKRIHHQLAPMELEYEQEFDQTILDFLSKKIQHIIKLVPKGIGFSALTAIGSSSDDLTAVYDFRRNGSSAIFKREL